MECKTLFSGGKKKKKKKKKKIIIIINKKIKIKINKKKINK